MQNTCFFFCLLVFFQYRFGEILLATLKFRVGFRIWVQGLERSSNGAQLRV